MAASTTMPVWTEEQLMALPNVGHKYELIEGRLMMTPAGGFHGDLGVRLSMALANFVRPRRLGWVLDSSTGFWMKSGNLRSPDVSFVQRSRFAATKRVPTGFIQGAPDLAVEILSPSDTVGSVHDRVAEYFENGTALAWVVNPRDETILVYRDACPSGFVKPDGSLTGDPVLPGFTLSVKDLFEVWD